MGVVGGDLSGEVDGGAFVAWCGRAGVESAVVGGVGGDVSHDCGDVVLGLAIRWDAAVLLDGAQAGVVGGECEGGQIPGDLS